MLQHGAFARWQLLPGVTVSAIKRRIQNGDWLVLSPGVYALCSSRDTSNGALGGWLAVGPDAVISHESAAQLHRIPNVVRDRVVLINRHGWHHRLPGIIVHQLDDLLPDHRSNIDGLPVTPARTIVDLSAVVFRSASSDRRGRNHANRVLHRRRVCMASVPAGKPGIADCWRTLDHLTGTGATTMSVLERDLFELIDTAGLPRPRSQFPFPGRLFTNGCVDAAYVDAKLVIEADGRAWHTRIADIKRDHERDADAARHGWQTLRLLYENIKGDPEGTAELVRDVRRERLLLLAS